MQHYRLFHTSSAVLIVILLSTLMLAAQAPKSARTPSSGATNADRSAGHRIGFDDARRLLDGEREGNLNHRPGSYSRTQLRDGRILELFYPIAATARTGARRRPAGIPGYGLLYATAADYEEAHRPRHILEELLPNGASFIGEIPMLIERLEKRLRTGSRRLEYTRASLRRIDAYLAAYRRTHTTADADPAFFQELTAYYGEVMRRELAAEWRIHQESIAQKHVQAVPNLIFTGAGGKRELKPWSTVLNVLYNEDVRGLTITAAGEADLRAARQ